MRSLVLTRVLSAALLAVGLLAPAHASPRRTKTPPKSTTKTPSPTPTASAAAPTPKPATLVPDPPYRGTPSEAAASSYAGILHAKQAGATEAQLLELVAKEGKRYSLSTPDIQKLRAAGVSSKVIEAMLRSDRAPLPAATPGVAPAATAAPAKTPASR